MKLAEKKLKTRINACTGIVERKIYLSAAALNRHNSFRKLPEEKTNQEP